jgi:hypothetical protein
MSDPEFGARVTALPAIAFTAPINLVPELWKAGWFSWAKPALTGLGAATQKPPTPPIVAKVRIKTVALFNTTSCSSKPCRVYYIKDVRECRGVSLHA